jgi:hypothetical protein
MANAENCAENPVANRLGIDLKSRRDLGDGQVTVLLGRVNAN